VTRDLLPFNTNDWSAKVDLHKFANFDLYTLRLWSDEGSFELIQMAYIQSLIFTNLKYVRSRSRWVFASLSNICCCSCSQCAFIA
jgi:hypothetical protein